MSGQGRDNASSVSPAVSALCDRFEREWKERRSPQIEEFLGGLEAHDRAAALHALTTLERRLDGGNGTTIRDDLERFSTEVGDVFMPVEQEATEAIEGGAPG